MKKRFLFTTSILMMLVGCSEDTTSNSVSDPVTEDQAFNEKRIAHKACLDNNYWLYQGECILWEDVPTEDRDELLEEVAGIIAVVNGVSMDEAMTMILETIKE